MSESDDLQITSNSSDHATEHVATPIRHSIYYFEPIVFRVEDVLFKVPKNGFMVNETIFPDMFSLPAAEGAIQQGSSDSNPIDLPINVSQTDFHGFLLLLYPYFHRARDDGVATYEELVGALKLATMWEFDQIRKKAIISLSPILKSRHAVENILLAKEYRVKRWLRDGYLKLVNTDNLSIQDLRRPFQLDWETIAGIFATQSYARKPTYLGETILVGKYLDTVFENEFKEMRVEVLE